MSKHERTRSNSMGIAVGAAPVDTVERTTPMNQHDHIRKLKHCPCCGRPKNDGNYHLDIVDYMTYRGSIHGVMHDLGIEEFFFHLRKVGGGNLVRCDFNEALYDDVHDASARRHAVVYVHGLITIRRVDREITKFRVERIRLAPALTEDRYHAFFGADPNYTGDIRSEDFIERNRDEPEAVAMNTLKAGDKVRLVAFGHTLYGVALSEHEVKWPNGNVSKTNVGSMAAYAPNEWLWVVDTRRVIEKDPHS